jgi:ATP-binding cassette subfamily C (CFTR/MRP) protein 10
MQIRNLLSFRRNGYEPVEEIDLEDLHADGRCRVRENLAACEYDLRQSWLTGLMRAIRAVDYLDESQLPHSSKNAAYYTPLAEYVRRREFGRMLRHPEILVPLVLSGVLEAVACLTTVAAPLLMQRVLQEPSDPGHLLALFGVSLVATMAGRSKDQICRVLAVRVSSILQLALFRKCLRFSGRTTCTEGRLVSCSTTDMMLLRNYILKMHDIWSSPLQLILTILLVLRLLGLSGLLGKNLISFQNTLEAKY